MSAGTLILAMEVIIDAPKFCSLLALVERAAGRRIVVIDVDSGRTDGEKLAAGLGIPLQEYVMRPEKGIGESLISPSLTHAWAFQAARKYSRPVIWVDTAFHDWKGPNLQHYRDIVTLDWVKARAAAPVAPAQEA